MTKRVVLLFDWRLGTDPHWLASGLVERGFAVTSLGIPGYSMLNREVRWRKPVLWWQYCVLGARGACIGRMAETSVVSWNFIAGVFAAALMRVGRGEGAPVLALNCIAHDKGKVHAQLRRLVFRMAFGSGYLYLTVNSVESAARYGEQFGFARDRMFVVRDVWQSHYTVAESDEDDDGYVFCGGEAARDWETFIAVTRMLPDLSFVAVARRADWPAGAKPGPNVLLRFDVPEVEFYHLARRARIVMLPLRSVEAAGLIVLIRSALLGRLVLTTRTSSTESCYPESRSSLLVDVGDADGFARSIRRYWNDAEARKESAGQVQKFILDERSPEVFVDRVAAILSHMDAR